MEYPLYPHRPIHNLNSLALLLGEPLSLLIKLARNSDKLYRKVPQVKKDGTTRETFDASEPLKSIQRKVVDRLLVKVLFPNYLHGGIRDINSPRSVYSNVKTHVGARSIILQDIKNFFPSITLERVLSVFKGLMGFSDAVSNVLARLVTRYGAVPQGASTSSYIANLVFWDVEPRLVAWIRNQKMAYSRFADDITISSFDMISDDLKTEVVRRVTGMLAAKGFAQKRQKLHVLKRGQAITKANQSEAAVITGLSVAGPRPGVTKEERKKIRSAVKEFETLALMNPDSDRLKELYNRAMGRIGRLLACGQSDGFALKQRMNIAFEKTKKSIFVKHAFIENTCTD